MTCKNCLHYEACKGTYFTFKQMIDKDSFDNEHYADVYNCPDFTDRSEWVHLPCKVEQQLWFVENGEVKASTVDRLVYEELSTDDIFTRIDGYGFSVFFEDVGKTVFLTREEAEKALEGMKEDG